MAGAGPLGASRNGRCTEAGGARLGPEAMETTKIQFLRFDEDFLVFLLRLLCILYRHLVVLIVII